MITTKTKEELSRFIAGERAKGHTIGFVPTMGALHNGHLSLIRATLEVYDICVASVFVNPTQFNNPRDLETYPRQPEKDTILLEENGCHCLFLPSVEEMYGEEVLQEEYDFGIIGKVMEGEKRPGHFEGVAQVVKRLFLAVSPDGAFFGEKDFQQIAIIRSMVEQENFSIRIHAAPIVRELSGLAMSSRNQRLTEENRAIAPMIYKKMQESKELKEKGLSPKEVAEWVVKELNQYEAFEVEYYQIVNAETLLPIKKWEDAEDIIACIACYCGDVRLIDNIHY